MGILDTLYQQLYVNNTTKTGRSHIPVSKEQIDYAITKINSQRLSFKANMYLFNGAVVTETKPWFNRFHGIDVAHETKEGLLKVLEELKLPFPK